MTTSQPAGSAPQLLSPPHTEWLSLIRYQARQAEEQSRAAFPLANLALNGFQDAVESMLGLVAEHHNITRRNKSDFDKLFDDVSGKFSDLASYRAPLLALNTARVNFKHHGNETSRSTIERHRGTAMNFLADASRIGFDQDFESISMTAFVRDDEARGHLESAAATWRGGSADRAAEQLWLAFNRLIHDYEQRKVKYEGTSLFRTQPPSRPSDLDPSRSKAGKYLDEWLTALDERQKLLAFGVDLRAYALFDAHTPSPYYPVTLDGQPPKVNFTRGPNTATLTEETFKRCYRFVLDTALRLGAEDYDFDGNAHPPGGSPSV